MEFLFKIEFVKVEKKKNKDGINLVVFKFVESVKKVVKNKFKVLDSILEKIDG